MKTPHFQMVEIPKDQWQHINNGDKNTEVIKAFKSSRFLVQVRMHGTHVKLCINKIRHESKSGKIIWEDGITWDELQEIKNQCGFKDFWLCEYFPAHDRVVNVANIRHLWVLDKVPDNTLTRIDGKENKA